MLGDDLANNRKTQPGPVLAGGEVRQEKAVLILLRETPSSVADFDVHAALFRFPAGANLQNLDIGVAGHRLQCIVEKVYENTLHLLRIQPHKRDVRGKHPYDANVLDAAVVKIQGIFENTVDVNLFQAGGRQSRETGELVDQPLERTRFVRDRLDALVEQLLERGGLDLPVCRRKSFMLGENLPVPPENALGRKLDRGQRVFDLVGEAPGDFLPGRHSLRAQQLRHVVQHQNPARGLPLAVDERSHGGGQVQRLSVQGQFDVPHGPAQNRRFVEEHPKRLASASLYDVFEPKPLDRTFYLQHLDRGAVHRTHPVVGVQGDHGGRDGLENRLDVAPAIVQLDVSLA